MIGQGDAGDVVLPLMVHVADSGDLDPGVSGNPLSKLSDCGVCWWPMGDRGIFLLLCISGFK